MHTREVLSVGIDVGTTTSELVLSRLTVRSGHRAGVAPRLEVTPGAVVHQGVPRSTPLRSPGEIDVERLLSFVEREFRAAGVLPADVDTGAVIITGEAARAKNAESILAAVSEFAGDFVVTVAGPNLEAQIAGRGSGAAAFSAKHYTTAINVDIGGGSANAAAFRSGQHLASAAVAVGGRQLALDPSSGTVTNLAPPGRALVADLGLELAAGQQASAPALQELTDAMADRIVDLVHGCDQPLPPGIALTPPLPRFTGDVAAVFLSGGVGRAYYDGDPAGDVAEIAAYGDVGPLLARSLRENARLREMPVRAPADALRATVLGAASQTVTLSGSTIWTRRALLPLRNLPVIEPEVGDPIPEPATLAAELGRAVRRWDREAEPSAAVALDLPADLDFPALQRVAHGVAAFARQRPREQEPVVLVSEHDYAQALGQAINAVLPEVPLIVIDQIELGEGDFIDIGQPVPHDRAVPVSVKTLVFYAGG
ncbi:ethanolamine ammonia-lyase reactivating factor EutA [Salinifilum ghardaiensis]